MLASNSPGKNLRTIDYHLACAAARRFGTFGKALAAAGNEPPTGRETDERVPAAIQSRFVAGEPTHIEGSGDIPLAQAARRRFGSWAEAVKASGLADRTIVPKPLRL